MEMLNCVRSDSRRLSVLLILLQVAMLAPIVSVLASSDSAAITADLRVSSSYLLIVGAGLSLAAAYPFASTRLSTVFIEKSIADNPRLVGVSHRQSESRESKSLEKNSRLFMRTYVTLLISIGQFFLVSVMASIVVGAWFLMTQCAFVIVAVLAASRRLSRGEEIFMNRVMNSSPWIKFKNSLERSESILLLTPLVLGAGLAITYGAIGSLERLLLLFGFLSVSVGSATAFVKSFPLNRYLLRNLSKESAKD